MKRFKYIVKTIILLFVSLGFYSCVNLDTLPKNMVGDEAAFGSLDGVEAYLAQVYYDLPIEDYNYTLFRGFNVQDHYWPVEASTGESICRDIGGVYSENHDWDYAYRNIRRINYFIDNLPNYASNYPTDLYDHLLGEGYFLRAYMYYSLAKRYGGVPYIDYVINYPECGFEGTYIPRNSEEETWDKIAADLDLAYNNMSDNSQRTGRANRYIAAAFKSRAMLFAGSIAKYNKVSHFDEKTGKRVCGIPEEKAVEYFQMTYDAAKLCEGHYSLYKKSWVAGDKNAQMNNFIEMFFANDNPELVFGKWYSYPNTSHSWDRFNLNRMYVADGCGSASCPTLEFVEMFEGMPMTSDGKFKTLDDNGHYILYADRFDPFKNAEPRLRASVLVPGEVFKDEVFDVRRGIYIKPVGAGIERLIPEESTDGYPDELVVQSSDYVQQPYTLPNGQAMYPAGKGGIYSSNAESAYSGFSIRKLLDPKMPYDNTYMTRSTQTWPEMRYAEVMLNRAEAAYELYLAGDSGADYLNDAVLQINEIRKRGGATELASSGDLNSIDIIRKERRKELAFENKTYWDLKRWRLLDQEQNNTTFRTLMPFYVAETGQYFYDSRYDLYNRKYTYDQRYYYHPIPSGEILRNPNMQQNPGF